MTTTPNNEKTYTAQGAWNAGREAFARSRAAVIENPYIRGTTDHQAWANGWLAASMTSESQN